MDASTQFAAHPLQIILGRFPWTGTPFDVQILLPMPSEQKPKSPLFSVNIAPAGEYDALAAALRQILKVSHDEMVRRHKAEKKAKASKPGLSVSSAYRAKD